MRIYLALVVGTALVTLVLVYVVWRLAMRYKWYPPVRDRDVHTTPKPRLGGVAMFVGMLLALAAASQIPFFSLVFEQPGRVWALVGAASLIVLIGVIDDFIDLDWMTKLAGQILAAILLAWQGVAITSLPIGGITVGSQWMSIAITVLAVVLVMNAVNFIDGLDGLVAGVAIIANGVFLVYSYVLSEFAGQTGRFTMGALLSAIVIGICLGFLVLNWYPSKMFMGDGGALLVGLLMAASAVAVTGEVDPQTISRTELWPAFLPMIIPFAVLIVPLLDFSLAVFRRMRAGKSPFTADRKHLHHRLLDMGHSQRWAVVVFYSWTAVVSVGALMAFAADLISIPIGLVIGFVVIGFVLCTLVTIAPLSRRKSRERHAQKAPGENAHDELADAHASLLKAAPESGMDA
ncbi:MraY family glycosyltransferase [Pseudoclavibacter sp. RFBA6]|uniref:MraY family glycosyltransferase n=1 Tax=Pseudoclavibacter sp. RFBA6 TaxID=2080573 RepID=UPI000CE86535|nr:MraY family glycosyltransferase [Pseudoclavibacter sp. RFBA6]PPG39389.1 undecaprenyl-phosphate alpha-N-acetylglucosaminyl 1-phosphate transferase [Pseudoclavibacter sp. RFBA6]